MRKFYSVLIPEESDIYIAVFLLVRTQGLASFLSPLRPYSQTLTGVLPSASRHCCPLFSGFFPLLRI